MNNWDTFLKVVLIAFLIVFVVSIFVTINYDLSAKETCIKAGYIDHIELNRMVFCYKINPATLTPFDEVKRGYK